MATTRVISSRDLISQESVQFIRTQILTLTLIDSRPTTKMYVFFGDTDVTHLCNLVGGKIGQPLITDTIGQAKIQFNLPDHKFNVGNHDILIADVNSIQALNANGSVFGFAKSTFSANGRVDIYQTTQTTIVTTERTVVNSYADPLAQSFFTTGVTGGMFLTSIETYFQTKDDILPVRCEIRPMVNGSPSSVESTHVNLISVVAPEDVETSFDASISTKFSFDPPLYLAENSDYCFILRSNSSNYNVFTSRMGENSIEDGAKIFSQPYIGSLFKSENAITWISEQFEDIKFKINKAAFDITGSGQLEFGVRIPPLAAYGNQFSTSSGSTSVTYVHNQEHGLEVGSKFNVITRKDALYTNASFNGIPFLQFNANHTVTEVSDRNTIKFNVITPATSSGKANSAKILTEIIVLTEGINYNTGDTISFSGGGGAGGLATLNVVNGNIKSVSIINAGSGYTSAPVVIISSLTGSGANVASTVTPVFSVYVNKPMTGFIPKLNLFNQGTSKNVNTMSTTIGNYDGGNLVTYSLGKTIEFQQNLPYPNINQNSLIASSYNEAAFMSGTNSSKVVVKFSTDNPNVSPVIDVNVVPTIEVYSSIINSQPGETISAYDSSGKVTSIVVTSAGSGYTTIPSIQISAPNLLFGVQATARATISAGVLTAINIVDAGSGYTDIPLLKVVGGGGVNASGQVLLSQFNTELLATSGSAKARYITKKTGIKIISTGARIFSTISSVQGSSVDWYIRTSLSGSGVVHDSKEWDRLSCKTERNKSAFVGEMFEYEFFLDSISQFDNYDLKCVMTAQDPTKAPIVNSYRLIVVA